MFFSDMDKLLDLHHAHQNWVHFEISDTPFETMGEGIMYLSSDAEQVLESIPEGATIVIGGLVDRNRHKGASHAAATAKVKRRSSTFCVRCEIVFFVRVSKRIVSLLKLWSAKSRSQQIKSSRWCADF